MEEKIIIKSEPCNVKNLLKTFVVIGAVISLFLILRRFKINADIYEYIITEWNADPYEYIITEWNPKFAGKYRKLEFVIRSFAAIDMLPLVGFAMIGALIYFSLHSYEMTVTNKRVYGKVAWGKRVDLPVDSISATTLRRFWRGVAVSTASGKISFLVMNNSNEIYNALSNLLVNRQNMRIDASAMADSKIDVTDQLKKFKELLDSGVITQEEFDTKKKQLLGL